MVRCLITGCEGFVGSHLADLLVDKGHKVYGTSYEDTKRLDHLKEKITLTRCDMNKGSDVDEVVKEAKPDYVFHLAAQSFVGVSWDNPKLTLRTNIIGTLNYLEAIRELNIDPTILIIGSSAVYGTVNVVPIKEFTKLRPTSHYAVSKVGEEMLGHMYYKAYGMKTIMIRPFNMSGPRKVGDACADFTKGLIEAEKFSRKWSALSTPSGILEVGNLETTRDITDGRDAVKGLLVLAEKGVSGEVYNLCSGIGHKMQEILDMAISLSGNQTIKIVSSKQKMRPYDDRIYVGDNSKLRRLGWKPEIGIEQTLSDMLEYWRKIP